MKALVAHDAKDLRLEEVSATGKPGPGEVKVDIRRGGICGSDLHYFHHGGFGTVRIRQPVILGHEISGEVSAVGDGVSNLKPGDLVAVSPSRPCGECEYCREATYNQCLNMRFYGSAMPMPHINGGFRESLIAKDWQCIPATGLSAAEAAMAEPLAVCLHAAIMAGTLQGKRVLITGSGPIGVLTTLVARRAGAREIVVTDLGEPQLEFARQSGADRTINLSADKDALAIYQKDKGYFDVQFECSGAAPALASGVAAVRPRGRIVQLGMGGDVTIPLQQITVKEISLTGTFRFHEEFALAVELMQKGLIKVDHLITHSFAIEDYAKAFEVATDKAQSMKVVIEVSNQTV